MKTLFSQNQQRAFTLVELMISLLLVSALGLGMSNYLRESSEALSDSDSTRQLDSDVAVANRQLEQDIKQVVYIHPSCNNGLVTNNPLNGAATTINCNTLKVRSGVTPLPGMNKVDLENSNDLDIPSNLEAPVSSLNRDVDALRLALFDFDQEFDCALYKNSSTENPAIGSETMEVNPDCAQNDEFTEGQVFVIVETDPASGLIFSNVFQITAIEASGSPADFYVLTSSSTNNNLYNQEGGLGISGFTSNARIYPIRFVEYAVDTSSSGLFRRLIDADSSNMEGYQNWIGVQANVESIQFWHWTRSTDVNEHIRTMEFDTTDAFNDGPEDIRGVSPYYVMRSSTERRNTVPTDNPMTSEIENDHYHRKEVKFFTAMKNFSN